MALALVLPWAAHAQVDVSNSTVTCNTIVKGAIKASPALVNGGTSASVFKVKGKLAACTTNAVGVTIPDGKSSFSGVINVPSNDCAALLTPGAVSGTVTLKWKGSVPITPTSSVITLNTGDATAGVYDSAFGNNALYGYFGLGINPRPSGVAGSPVAVTGAFTGGSGGVNSTADIVTAESIAMITGQCAAAGVKTITIGIAQIRLN
jgi:hypothetical protein